MWAMTDTNNSTPAEPTPAEPSAQVEPAATDPGVEHESLIETILHTGEKAVERMIHEFDEAGQVVSWHKEPHSG